MDEFRSNSFKSKEAEERKVEKVVLNDVKVQKKSGFNRIKDELIVEDKPSIVNYILFDAVIPSIKKTISDVVDMILFGSPRGGKTNKVKEGRPSYYNYASSYDDRTIRPKNRAVNNMYDDILFSTRGDAEAVLAELDELISIYGIVSIKDLYSSAGVSTTNYTFNDYGWTDIRSAEVMRVREGYIIKMPRALPLN